MKMKGLICLHAAFHDPDNRIKRAEKMHKVYRLRICRIADRKAAISGLDDPRAKDDFRNFRFAVACTFPREGDYNVVYLPSSLRKH